MFLIPAIFKLDLCHHMWRQENLSPCGLYIYILSRGRGMKGKGEHDAWKGSSRRYCSNAYFSCQLILNPAGGHYLWMPRNDTPVAVSYPYIYRMFLFIYRLWFVNNFAPSERILTNSVSINSTKLGLYEFNKLCSSMWWFRVTRSEEERACSRELVFTVMYAISNNAISRKILIFSMWLRE